MLCLSTTFKMTSKQQVLIRPGVDGYASDYQILRELYEGLTRRAMAQGFMILSRTYYDVRNGLQEMERQINGTS